MRTPPPGVERLSILVIRLHKQLLFGGLGDNAKDLQLLNSLRSTVEAIEPAYEVALVEMEKAVARD